MTGQEWEVQVQQWLSDLPLWAHYNEPKVRGGYKIPSGLPDFSVLLNGTTHLIECKLASKAIMPLGQLTGKDGEAGAGIRPGQAREMDAATKQGARCWIAVRLELPETAQRKLAQQRLVGAGGDVPACVQRLIPWDLWRARMEAAEIARRDGGDVVASIPAAELAELGWPLRSAGELLAALQDELPW